MEMYPVKMPLGPRWVVPCFLYFRRSYMSRKMDSYPYGKK